VGKDKGLGAGLQEMVALVREALIFPSELNMEAMF